MKKNRYISRVKVLFGAALILSTVERSSSLDGLLGGVARVERSSSTSRLPRRAWQSYSPERLLRSAVLSGDKDSVECLVSQGADINATDNYGRTALHLAARSGRTDIVRLLIRCGADINAIDHLGSTALHGAVKSGNVDTVNHLMFRYLKSGGAGVSMTDDYGRTPLRFAVESGNRGIIKSLIPYCENINATNFRGIPLFHYAKNVEVIKCLASFGANPNASNSRQYTALHFAAQQGNEDVARCLIIDLNVRVNPLNYWEKTPLDIAMDQDVHPDLAAKRGRIAQFLRDHGAVSGRDIRTRNILRQHTGLGFNRF
ncbi:MAG: ankyrin repeat domain-containing protein [Holosporaceae bacterium]|jgi:ankyrin repeat protein|nr:ankyrin repeat domain-containing protein [Holosporaceae bacterium]